MPMMPIQRASCAQAALYTAITAPFRNRQQIADALCSVVSTAKAAAYDTGGIKVLRGHTSMRESNPTRWAPLESAIWEVVHAGHTPGAVWEEVEKQLNKIGVEVGNLHDVAALAAKQRSQVA